MWEYKVIEEQRTAAIAQKVIEKLGQLDWELVAVDQGTMYFKRPRRQDETPNE